MTILAVIFFINWTVTVLASGNDRTLYWTLDIVDIRQTRVYVHNGDPEEFLRALREGDTSVDTQYSHFPSSAARFGAISADNRATRSVFVHNKANGKIYNFYRETNSATSIFKGSSKQVSDVAVDWLSQNLYYTDPAAGVGIVSYTDPDHTWSTILINKVAALGGIDVDPQAGLIFYTDGDSGYVYEASLTGQDPVVISDGRTSEPTYLAADPATHTVYWLGKASSQLQAWNYHTKTFTVVWTSNNIREDRFAAIEVYKNYLFLPFKRTTGIVVVQTNGTFLQDFSVSTFRHVYPGGICVSAPERQPNIHSACDVDNGGCQHICVHVSATSCQCLCQFGYTLQEDGTSCGSDLPEHNFLMMADPDSKAIYMVKTDTEELLFHAVPLPTISREQADDVTYDLIEQDLYWTERNLHQIWKMNVITQKAEEFYAFGSNSINQGITIDDQTRQLYYTDSRQKHIGKIDLTAGHHSVVLRLDYRDKPLDIQIDHTNRTMYWTSWGYPPMIEKADLTGTNRRRVVYGRLSVPSGIALDVTAGHLYFVDMKRRSLERVDLGGSNMNRIYIASVPSNTIGVAIDSNFIYVASRSVLKISKSDHSVTNLGPHYFGGVFGMAYYNTSDEAGNTRYQK